MLAARHHRLTDDDDDEPPYLSVCIYVSLAITYPKNKNIQQQHQAQY